MTERKGLFITFEGPDGSGKSTQIRLLADRLRGLGRELVETQEPGGTHIGLQIRSILLDPSNDSLCPIAEMLLYFAARAQNFDEKILPAWNRGAIVLSDRFTDSTLAYQGDGRGIERDTILSLHDIACHGLQPDLTICIDVEAETGLARARARKGFDPDRLEKEAVEFHHRVRNAYLELARQNPERIKIVNGHGTVEQVAAAIWRIVEPRV